MASSMIHLAIASELTKRHTFHDIDRLRLGSILPDASGEKVNSHLKILIYGGTQKTLDINRFRQLFGNLLLTDDLYLGYYLHLAQDILFRHFIYGDYHWDPHIPGNVARLHRDYQISNYCVASKYGLGKNISVPDDIYEEPLCGLADFHIQDLVDFLTECFEPVGFSDTFFFTTEMADEFIGRAVPFCLEELERLERGQPGLDAKQLGCAV